MTVQSNKFNTISHRSSLKTNRRNDKNCDEMISFDSGERNCEKQSKFRIMFRKNLFISVLVSDLQQSHKSIRNLAQAEERSNNLRNNNNNIDPKKQTNGDINGKNSINHILLCTKLIDSYTGLELDFKENEGKECKGSDVKINEILLDEKLSDGKKKLRNPFGYQCSSIDDKLNDTEVDKMINELDHFPSKESLYRIWWNVFRNERTKYENVNKDLLNISKKFQKKYRSNDQFTRKQFQKCQHITSTGMFNKEYEILNLFYRWINKESLTSAEFKKFVRCTRNNYKNFLLDTKKECVQLIEEAFKESAEKELRSAHELVRQYS
ncbi:Plasmodium exported protein (PHISTb), unknown function [Plasmodium ovale curtisi]|uniref:Plasmodium RESA N-terminal domain-containing protein n=1 Tax=Plasmodium ovale curtisi TaxID=864141 RepID=A0A1A8XA60_PLAOA|nr:Plasmodium exported protein (PHISTb), unknown function [Plasmodium ovale curtisi]SBT02141.1 Plasmodium exported protein (PHISTb), unknown function [Plasmodium ovale curtisi]